MFTLKVVGAAVLILISSVCVSSIGMLLVLLFGMIFNTKYYQALVVEAEKINRYRAARRERLRRIRSSLLQK